MILGTIVNVATVIVGSSIGLLFRSRIPQRIVDPIFHILGLVTLLIGIQLSLKSQQLLLLIFSLLLGTVTGTIMRLDEHSNNAAERLKKRLHIKSERFTDGLITAFLMFCMGSMTILGAFEEGTGGQPNLLMTKAMMDGFSSMAMASALGVGVLFAVVPLFIYQASLTLCASWISDAVSQGLIDEISAAGGIMLIGLGFNILNITKFKLIDMLPSFLFVVLFYYLSHLFV